jgi:di/tricarboxylate transporter
MLLAYVLLGVAPAQNVFNMWLSPLMYLIVGGYLIAAAVQVSGLGKRIAYQFLLRVVSSYRSVIISCYVLGFLLSFLIPHPWPRSFLIMGVMAVIIKSTDMPKRDAMNIGLAVFAASAPISMILLTGDSTINIVAVGFSGVELGWLGWLKYMSIPGIAASVLTCVLQLMLFKPSGKFAIDKSEVAKQLKELGSISLIEKKTIVWIGLAIVLWVTDSVHGIHIGWVTLGVALMMSLPTIGDILKPPQWAQVPIATLFFLTAALAIGKVGAITGMNDWIASVVLPSEVPTNFFLLALMITVITILLHMVLGSVMAVMGIATPALVGYAVSAGINPLVPALMVYTAIAMHWILPFHHMNLLVGLGEDGGMYSDREVMRLGIPLTVCVFIVTVIVEVVWWQLTGLL